MPAARCAQGTSRPRAAAQQVRQRRAALRAGLRGAGFRAPCGAVSGGEVMRPKRRTGRADCARTRLQTALMIEGDTGSSGARRKVGSGLQPLLAREAAACLGPGGLAMGAAWPRAGISSRRRKQRLLLWCQMSSYWFLVVFLMVYFFFPPPPLSTSFVRTTTMRWAYLNTVCYWQMDPCTII